MMDGNFLGLIFANSHDDKLAGLTASRSMGAVPFGCRYRLIDFILSNFTNAGIMQVGVIAEKNYHALMGHLGPGKEWDLARKRQGLMVLPPFIQSGDPMNRGRLGLLSQLYTYVKDAPAKYCILADCDTVINLDLREMFDYHLRTGADITIAYKEHTPFGTYRGGVGFQLNEQGRIVDVEIRDYDTKFLYNTNLVMLEKKLLEELILQKSSRSEYSFTRNVMQAEAGRYKIMGYEIPKAAMVIDSQYGYYHASLSLLSKEVRDDLFCKERPIYTRVRDEVPARYGLDAFARNSLVADGAIIEGTVENSLVFRGVKVEKGAIVRNSILLNGTVVGQDAKLDCCLTDRRVTIQSGRVLTGQQSYPVYIAKGSVV